MGVVQTAVGVRLYSHTGPDDHYIFAAFHLKDTLTGDLWEELQDRT
jgi:hypothetical protein